MSQVVETSSPSGPRLVLASTSKYRRALLERLEVAFEAIAPSFDEATLEHRFGLVDDDAFALELALAKAESLRARAGDAYILAADQIAVLPGSPPRLLHKPGTEAQALEQLMALRGSTHTLTTGVVLLDGRTGTYDTAVDHQRMTMRTFSREEAERYVERHKPLDAVGAYRIEDAGIRLFASVEGHDATGIIGLPLLAVCELLRRVNLLP